MQVGYSISIFVTDVQVNSPVFILTNIDHMSTITLKYIYHVKNIFHGNGFLRILNKYAAV